MSAVRTDKKAYILLYYFLFFCMLSVIADEQTHAAETTTALIQLSTDGPFELIVNAKVIKKADRADMMEIETPIGSGANDFLLKLHQGTAAMRIKAPGLDITGDGWEIASLNDPYKTAKDLSDDSAWELAATIGNDPILGAIVGKPNQPIVLHRTILWKKTRVWPSPVPAFYLPGNGTMRMNFIIDGITGKKLKHWTTYLAIPPEIECIGSSSFYGTWDSNQPLFTTTPLGKIKIEGQLFDYYRISADKPIDSSKQDILKILQIFLQHRGNEQQKREDMNIIFWSEANNGGLVEGRQSLPVKLIEGLNGKQPRQFVFELYGGWFSRLDNLQMRNETLKTAKLAGFNHISCNDAWCSDNVFRNGLKNIIAINFTPWSIDLAGHLKAQPGDRLLKQDGTYSDSLMCTTKMLNDGWPAVELALQKKLDQLKPHIVDYDYEYPPFNGPHSCYCPVCLDQFRKFAEIPSQQNLNPKIIKETYGKQWVDFMARRAATMFSLLRGSIHRLSPGTQYSVYSGYQTPDNAERYGVNWHYVGELHAVDQAGCGYGRPVAAIKETIDALKGIPLVGGVIVTPYNINETSPPNELNTAAVLRQFFDTTGGILAYSYMEMGGQSWHAVSQVSRFVATHEEFLLKGKRFSLKGQDEASVLGVKYGSDLLICLMNNKSRTEKFSINLPAGSVSGHEFFTGSEIDAHRPIECSLQPGEAKIYVITTKNDGEL